MAEEGCIREAGIYWRPEEGEEGRRSKERGWISLSLGGRRAKNGEWQPPFPSTKWPFSAIETGWGGGGKHERRERNSLQVFFPPTLTAARQVELFLLPCYRVWLGSFVRSFPCSHERRNRTLAAAITRPSVACCRQQTYPRFSVSHEKWEGRRARVYSLSCIQQPLFSTAAPRVFKRDSKEKKSIAAASRRDGEKNYSARAFRLLLPPCCRPLRYLLRLCTIPTYACFERSLSLPFFFFRPGK